MNLSTEFEKLGFYTREFEKTLCITTPQTFASGDPVSFYVTQDYDQIIFDDYGVNIHSLELSLPNPKEAKRIVSQQLNKFQNEIQFNGHNIVRRVEANDKTEALSEFISLFAYLTNYKPKNNSEVDRDLILEDIFLYLRKNHDSIKYNYNIEGISGANYTFDFLADETLVDFTSGHYNATGSLLRKIHDVQNLVKTDFDFEVFIDDSDKIRARKESKIISSIANVIPLSVVERAA